MLFINKYGEIIYQKCNKKEGEMCANFSVLVSHLKQTGLVRGMNFKLAPMGLNCGFQKPELEAKKRKVDPTANFGKFSNVTPLEVRDNLSLEDFLECYKKFCQPGPNAIKLFTAVIDELSE